MPDSLPEPVWRAAFRSRGRGAGSLTATDHAVRGSHTLCGIDASFTRWHDPVGRRCRDCAATPPEYATHHDLVGPMLTYRQLDHWTQVGWLRPIDPHPGVGGRRLWTAAEARVAATMGRLTAAGLTPAAAHRAARNDGWLAGGVRVVILSDHDDHHGDDQIGVVRH